MQSPPCHEDLHHSFPDRYPYLLPGLFFIILPKGHRKTIPSLLFLNLTLSTSSSVFSLPQTYQGERNASCAQKVSSVQRLNVPNIRKFPLAILTA